MITVSIIKDMSYPVYFIDRKDAIEVNVTVREAQFDHWQRVRLAYLKMQDELEELYNFAKE